MVLRQLLLAVVGIADRDLAGGRCEREIDCLLECRSLLHKMVADEAEGPVLRKDGGLLLKGAIFKTEVEATCDLIAARDLSEIAFGDRVSFQSAENKKSMHQAFPITHLDRSP